MKMKCTTTTTNHSLTQQDQSTDTIGQSDARQTSVWYDHWNMLLNECHSSQVVHRAEIVRIEYVNGGSRIGSWGGGGQEILAKNPKNFFNFRMFY